MPLIVEEHVGFSSFPFFYELLASSRPTHDRELMAVNRMGVRKIERKAETVTMESIFVMNVNQPEHPVALSVKGVGASVDE
ncbi:hypothetical protein [Rhizobium ruizarguesonis]|uniref:hypothetical protein n=1 Tax=Rhizobium ruizarguesonis TaxID=2081791 RepID=UPI001A8E9148|nr:hypothetical protein [Rhizobium ruizarguesonis]